MRKLAETARQAFVRARDGQLRLVRAERRTMKQVLVTLERKYNRLLSAYLRADLTTYEVWQTLGPKRELDELNAAAADPSAWDRLVETFDAKRGAA